jgi:hypothetical protein
MYTALHNNLPSPDERKAEYSKWAFYTPTLRQIKWMIIIIIAPEIGVAMANEDRESMKNSCDDIRNLDLEEDWRMKHAYFAGIGGIALRFKDSYECFPLYS